MEIKLLLLAGLAALAAVVTYQMTQDAPRLDKTEFRAYASQYGKTYNSVAEEEFRFKVFQRNVARINEVNAKNLSYKLGINQFTDLTFEEFKKFYLSPMVLQNELVQEGEEPKKGKKDWREAKVITKVKDQGQCGSCWAFSATGSLEAAVTIKQKLKKPIELSEQELVDCSGEQGNEGCNGGLMTFAFEYIKAHKINTEADYPYTAQDGDCSIKPKQPRFGLTSYKLLPKFDVANLISALDITPVSVAIEVQDDFMSYKSGVYESEDEACGEGLNHGVLAVGYDTTVAKPFFIVKNSWSENWGEKGYIRMAVGKGSGTCGIANKWDTYPIV